ncbi:gamma-glutamyltransferase [candidate division KSB1 bacterium]|nr:gamma-glutamyltransferase [candidate division KSB1 bacterium]
MIREQVLKKIESDFVADGVKCSVAGKGMVATQSPYASEAGAEMLRSGGNAVDAAVAAALALAVAEPQASGLGGQTMMLLSHGKDVMAVDGSSRAPSLAHVNAIYQSDRSLGYRAATVPSTPATLWYVQDRYGKLNWPRVCEPAITLAENGYPISALQHKLQDRETEKFLRVESRSGAFYFLQENRAYNVGDVFKQKDLADLLRRLAEKGVTEFYQGKIARQIDADMRDNGGLLHYDDLALIPFPIEREPLVKQFRGLQVYTMPPPGSGRTLLFALLMLDLIPQNLKFSDPLNSLLLFIHVLRKALLERSDRPYDPNFFPQIADETLMLDPLYARECLEEILNDVDKALIPIIPTEDELTGETTHLSVMDNNGLAVSLTQSIERVYGSKAAAAGLGFLYNNYLYDFDYNLPEHPFYLRPNQVPWATVAPTLVFSGNRVWMALGSPGSERIISTLALFLLNVLDDKMSIDAAMRAPRIFCSLGGRVSLEAGRFPQSLLPYLEYKGFRIDRREDYSFYLGCVQAVLKKLDGSGFQGVADVRRDGTAVGV